nr:FG-GAP-like repeat-containing protein [Woeseiaceae bacterium]
MFGKCHCVRNLVSRLNLGILGVALLAGFTQPASAALSVSPSPSTGSFTVSWSAIPGADDYRLRESTNGGTTWSGNYYVWGTAKSFAGKPVGTYTYKLRYCVEIYMRGEYFPRCYDSSYPTVSVTVQPPGPATPTGLSGPATDDDGAFSITWNAVSGATHYTIERQTDGGGWSFATDVITPSYGESGLASGSYDYRVKACSASTCSSYSSTTTVTVTIAGPPPPPPPVPGSNGDPGVSRESDETGTIAGTFRVDESGAATYSIPIMTAAGTAGVEPEISLNYSSSSGNGIAGMGWSIGGMSAITRCKQTYDQDRNPLPITWSSSDRYCLDGQRLLLENPAQSYGAANTTYRTEVDTGSIVTIRGNSNGEPDYFEVRRKDGSTSYYGKSPNDPSNVSAKTGGGGGKTFIWALRHFRDNIGNPIWFDYYNDGAGQRVKTIYWAFGTGRGPVSGHGARLEFQYIDRDDDRLGYVAGVALRTQKLLKTIRSYNVVGSSALIREYTLYYDEQTTSNDKISRLTSIDECVGNTCLPRTEFRWNIPANYTYLSQLSSRNLAESNNLSDLTLADINGDGMMDLVWLEGQPANAVFNYATSNGTSLSQRPFSNGNMEYAPYGSAEKLTPIDYNLDGRDDIAYWDDNANRWKVIISAPQNDRSWRLKTAIYSTPIDSKDVTFVDIDSNGTTDAVWATGGTTKQLKLSRLEKRPNQQASSSIYYYFGPPVNIGTPGSATTGKLHAVAADLNGDGRIGLVIGRDAPFCEYEFNPPLCFGPKYANLLNITNPMSQTPGYSTYANLNNTGALWDNEHVVPSGIVSADVNADGLSDFFYPVYQDPNNNVNWWHLAVNRGNGSFDVTEHYEPTMSKSGARRPQFVDWNGDNFPDLMWKSTQNSGTVYVRYWNPSTNRLDARVTATTNVNTSNNESVFFPDMNGDGVPDMLKIDTGNGAGKVKIYTRKTGYTVANRAANRIREIENGLGAKTTINYEPLSYSNHYERLEVDVTQSAPGGGPVHCIIVGEPGIEDICVNRSVWEVNAGGFYEQINGDWDLPDSMASLKKTSPVIEVSGPMYVVTDVTGSAPAGSLLTPGALSAAATSSIEYHYYEAKVQAAGRGFLGFEQLRTVDTIAGVSTTTQYRQDWPFTGLPVGTVVSSAAGHIIGGGSTTWEVLQWDAAKRSNAEINGTATLGAVHVQQTVNRENTYDIVNNGAGQGALLSTVLTATQFDSEANAEIITVTTTNELTGQDELLVTTTNVFDSVSFNLWDGRLKSTTVVTDRPSFAGTATRNAGFAYYTSGPYRGMLYKEITEPGHPDFELTNTFYYDAYGNRKKVTVGDGTTTRCSAPAATAIYESSGRYVDYNYDCLGRLTTHVVTRNAYGQPTRVDTVLDANNTYSRLTTNVYYGALGREYYRSAEDGSFQTTYLTPNAENCPSGSAYKATTYTAGGGTSEICFDVLARETRKLTLGFDGEWDAQDTIFDQKGRVLHKSEPFDLSSGASYWTTQEYDLLDRPGKTTLPDNTWSEITYSGFDTQTTISYQSQTRSEKKNALGDLIEASDNIGGTSRFTYDNLGNPRTSTDAAGNVTTTVHNDLGQKTLMETPDSRSGAGTWTYRYNHFGELKKQTNPNGHTSQMTYDGAGRMKTRVDRINGTTIEASATWNYDSSPNGLGKIDNVTDTYSGYTQATLYDSLGRVDEVVTNFDGGAYFEKTTYDEFGRVYQYFDAAGNGSFADHGVVNQYGYF